jgi:N-acyl-D-amino-acid deacylase
MRSGGESVVALPTTGAMLKVLLALLAYAAARSASLVVATDPPAAEVGKLKAAIRKTIALVETSAAEYRRQRQCFSCHHQSAPVLMLKEAQSRGFSIDEENLTAQLDHTAAHIKRGEESYRGGQGQGGKADTAGWALWTLETGGRKPDEATAAVAQFLLKWQDDRDHWRASGNRPPTEASHFTTTYVALRGLASFGTDEQKDDIAKRRRTAVEWVNKTDSKDTEDRIFRLLTLHYVEADETAIETAAKELLRSQADDGGWAQTADLKSDAYATGTALYALHEAGRLAASDPAYRKAVDFLLRTELDDGSWHVVTRSKPIQEYFESGFPHGKDQFISITATCWATTALLFACPTVTP